ncbi:hypothetical protein [Nonomuraea turcica]|uniref:hypothetical protein n=1 Tax=Nonomuraea sp. G32 TaxID=3067274 RepID=UPI00273AC62D|nr:hypothetical protein [Nonomuraea sp. G32]MDP4510352.1 hypothetical protein [Nonomuraea sp. G32]
MTNPPTLETAAVAAADEALRRALAGRPLVSAERFCASGRTTYASSRPVVAARPTLALGCYPAWTHRADGPAMQAAAEQDTGVRGPAQRRTWMHALDRRARALLADLPAPPVIAAWYADDRLRAWAGRARGVVAAVDGRVRALVEDKARFDALLAAAGVPARMRIPALRVDGRLPALVHLQRAVGAERLVIQAGCDSGGRGTRFVSTAADLDRAGADLASPYRVAAFIEGWASNVTVLNVPDGRGGVDVFVDRPSHKAVGVAEAGIGPAKSAGNDWSRPWPGRAATDLIEAAVQIGRWLWRRHRLAGLFGLDALLTPDGRVLLNEINCRKQGTTETSAVNQHLAGLPTFLVAHLTVLLGGQVQWLPGAEAANTATLEAATRGRPGPFYLKLRHRHAAPARLRGLAGPGVYQLSAAGLRWLRAGATPADADADTDAGEVLLADLPAEHVLLLPGAELGTAEGMTCGTGSPFAGPHELSAFGRSLLTALSAQLSPEPTREVTP